MGTQVTLTEAAAFLGVGKSTLRNWDKAGRTPAARSLANGRRTYDMDDLIQLKKEIEAGKGKARGAGVDSKTVKRAVFKLNSIIRDSDADSNIITRFDEVSKLLFLKLYAERDGFNLFQRLPAETEDLYVQRIMREYRAAAQKADIYVPDSFKRINLSGNTLLKCGRELARVSYSSASVDVKGLAYEDIIRGTFDKNDNQQFFTPYQIVNFMVEMMKDYLRGTVCDPACGTAGFLIRVAQTAPGAGLLGFEVDQRLAWVSNLNLLIHGKSRFKVLALGGGGCLGGEASAFFGEIDAILTNPPFGSDYTDPSILSRYSLGAGRASRRRGILFIEQAWNLLREGGAAAIIVDQGVLNSASSTDVRRYILDRFQIQAIVNLPEQAFMPYANVNSSVLILKKVLRPVEQTGVFYAKSAKIGRKPNGDDDWIYAGTGEASLDSDLPQIVEQWNLHRSGRGVSGDGCFVADVSESLPGNSTLRLDYDYQHPVRKESLELLERSRYVLRTLAEVCVERNQGYLPASDQEASTILYTGLANIEPCTGRAAQVVTPAASVKSAVKRYEAGDVVFSKLRPGLRKAAVMPYPEGGYVSYECAVLTVRKDGEGNDIVDPRLLSALLRSDFVYGQIMGRVTGLGRPRINGKDLMKIRIPIPPAEVQRAVVRALDTALASARRLRERARRLSEAADAKEREAVNGAAKTMMGEL